MSFGEEITKAIGAHGMWKMRLRSAIDAGKADANPVDVAKDNVCPFGQWLYGPAMSAAIRSSMDYATVRRLHAEFHKCASKVLECVAVADKAKAESVLSGDYAKISTDLTAAMMKWKSAAV